MKIYLFNYDKAFPDLHLKLSIVIQTSSKSNSIQQSSEITRIIVYKFF